MNDDSESQAGLLVPIPSYTIIITGGDGSGLANIRLTRFVL